MRGSRSATAPTRRTLGRGDLEPPPDLVVADLSFISLRTVAPALRSVATDDADFVLLVKPQFEAGRAGVGKGGIVRDASIRRSVLGEVVDGLSTHDIGVKGVVASPLRGADGNVEFLVWARPGRRQVSDAALDAAASPLEEASDQASQGSQP